jgi:hypothetical protein
VRFLILFFCAAFIVSSPAAAKPITYPGGWAVMTMNDMDSNAANVTYTLTPRFSVGVQHEYLRGPEANADTAELNTLLKRWNNAGSQANLFLKSGAGIAYKDGEADPALYGGLLADWENRRFFTSYENRFYKAGDIESFARHTGRVGVAPYIGKAGDIHTWLMLQTDYEPGKESGDDVSVTPLVRVFKGQTLLEAGYNLDGGVLFHAMVSF